MATYTQSQLDSMAKLKASNAAATPGATPTAPTAAPNFTVNQADVRPTGTAFNPMQDLQRSSLQTTGKPVVVPPTFDAGALGGTPKPVVPTAPQPQGNNPDVMAGTATDYVTKFNEAQKQAEAAVPDVAAKENESLYTRVKDLFGQQLNKGTDLLAAQEQANVGGITKQIEEQNLLVTQKANQYQKNIQMLPGQGRGITTGIISGQTDRERRLAAADIGAETAILQAMQGNLTLAKQTAQDAIDLKYKPIEDEVEQKLKLLELNAPNFTAEEKKKADITAGILQEQQQQIADKKKTEGDVSNVLAEAAKNGATQDVLQKIKASQNVNDAIINAGEFYGQTNEKTFVQDLVAKYPDAGITLNDTLATAQDKLKGSRIYQEQVRPPSKGGSGGGSGGPLGLTNQQIDNISPLITQFQNSPTVKNYNVLGETLNFVNGLDPSTNNPTDDQALIYAIAKALDPDSVVREGEYATVQKYSQSWAQAYGKTVEQAFMGTGFLSETARNNIKATLQSRFKATETSYNNLYDETKRRVNLIGNTDKGAQLLNNYGNAFKQQNTGTQPITVEAEYGKQILADLGVQPPNTTNNSTSNGSALGTDYSKQQSKIGSWITNLFK